MNHSAEVVPGILVVFLQGISVGILSDGITMPAMTIEVSSASLKSFLKSDVCMPIL